MTMNNTTTKFAAALLALRDATEREGPQWVRDFVVLTTFEYALDERRAVVEQAAAFRATLPQ